MKYFLILRILVFSTSLSLIMSCQSFERKLSENNQLQQPIQDCSTVLSQHYPPALSKIQIENHNKPFGKALEEELRSKGYAIVLKPKNETKGKTNSYVSVDYILDQLTPTTFKLRFSAGEKFYTYRIYEMVDNQLKATSPLSIEWRE
jgi:hypothetical protein